MPTTLAVKPRAGGNFGVLCIQTYISELLELQIHILPNLEKMQMEGKNSATESDDMHRPAKSSGNKTGRKAWGQLTRKLPRTAVRVCWSVLCAGSG